MAVPSYGSLQNNTNKEYRCDHATKLMDTFESPECLMNFVEQHDGTFGIKDVKNDEYFDSSITSMSGSIDGNSQKWRLLQVPDVSNGYYVQNVKNNEFMTKHASQLSSSAGADEIWIIKPRNN